MPDKKFTAKLELSRREEEVVRGFAEYWLAQYELDRTDARQRIYAEIVKHKFGEYTLLGERNTPEPLWTPVFNRNLCPESNTAESIIAGKDLQVLEEDGGNLSCRHCGFTISKALWEEGRKSNETERGILEKDKKFSEKVSKYNIPKEHFEELARMGLMEAQRAVRATTTEGESRVHDEGNT